MGHPRLELEQVIGIEIVIFGNPCVLPGEAPDRLPVPPEGEHLDMDDVAEKAAVAAEKADDVGRKVDRVHDDVLNGPLRQNVKRAIAESETDPHIVERRIETTARGVQQDRHETASREQAAYARGVTDTIRRFRPDGGELPPEQAQ